MTEKKFVRPAPQLTFLTVSFATAVCQASQAGLLTAVVIISAKSQME